MSICKAGRLTLRRGGDFRIQLKGPTHCGVESFLELQYLVEVECNVSLDRRGFLFDQLHVKEYFESLRETELSCEELVLKCSRDIHDLILKDAPECQIRDFKLSINSKGWQAAFVTFHFNDQRDTLPAPLKWGEDGT